MITHFFKIILSTQPKLRLPQKFVREHENSLPSKVSVEAPCGPSWKIELIRFNGEIWLDNGFEQFMEYYSIKLGYLLSFRYYLEELCFRVVIFDTSATEIDYPVKDAEKIIQKQVSPECCPLKEGSEVSVDVAGCLLDDHGICGRQRVGNGERVEEDDSSDASVEILEEIPSRRKVEGGDMKDEGSVEVLGEFRKAKKRRRANGIENLRIEEKRAVRKEGSSRTHESERIRNIGMNCETSRADVFPSCAKEKTKYDCSVQCNKLSYSETENRLYARAQAFVTRNPSFIAVMRHSHIVGCLNIKKGFAEEILKVQDTCDVVLCIPDCRRTWTAKCYFGQSNMKLYWRQFVKDNGLCHGDVCVIELLNGARLTLNVIIFRNNKNIEYGGGEEM